MFGFETHEQSVSVLRTVWVKCVMNGSINHVFFFIEAGNGREIRVHKVN